MQHENLVFKDSSLCTENISEIYTIGKTGNMCVYTYFMILDQVR